MQSNYKRNRLDCRAADVVQFLKVAEVYGYRDFPVIVGSWYEPDMDRGKHLDMSTQDPNKYDAYHMIVGGVPTELSQAVEFLFDKDKSPNPLGRLIQAFGFVGFDFRPTNNFGSGAVKQAYDSWLVEIGKLATRPQ